MISTRFGPQDRVDGRGIATNVFRAVSDPHNSPYGFKTPPGGWVPTESFEHATPDALVKENVYRTPEGVEHDRVRYDSQSGDVKEVQVERFFPTADGKGDIRRLYTMSLETATDAAMAASGALNLTRYFRSTDYISHSPDTQSRNLGWAEVKGDPFSGEAVINAEGLLWHGTDGERPISYHGARIELTDKEADRQFWLRSHV